MRAIWSTSPGQGHAVPIWILGSSLFGAQLAAMLGLPYASASHFARRRKCWMRPINLATGG